MATTSASSTAWGCPQGLLPGLGPRLFTFRRGPLKSRCGVAQPRPTAFSGPVPFSRPSSGSAGGKRFSLPPERASGAQPSPTTRPPEFKAWVYHTLGGGALETVFSLASISITLTGIAATLFFQRAQTTGVLPVIGPGFTTIAQQVPTVATATPRPTATSPDGWQQEVVAGQWGEVSSASASVADDTADPRSVSRSVLTTAEAVPEDEYGRSVKTPYRAMPYGMSAADHVYDTPWTNLSRWAVHALHYQEALQAQHLAMATTATASEMSAVSSEHFDLDGVPAATADADADAGMAQWVADSLVLPAAAVTADRAAGSTPTVSSTANSQGICTAPGAVTTAPSERGIGSGAEPESAAEVPTAVRRSASFLRGARALLRLSRHVAHLPLRVVDWALQMDQPISYSFNPPLSSVPLEASRAPAAAPVASAAEADGAAKGGVQTPATAFAARTPLDVRIATGDVNEEVVERPACRTATVAAVQAPPMPRRQQLSEGRKGTDPWVAAAEAEVAVETPGSGPVKDAMHALYDTVASVKSFAKAAASAAEAQLSVYGNAHQTKTSTSLTPAVVAQLPGGVATAVFMLALSAWLSSWAVVLLARAASQALGRRAATAAVGHGMSTREYFGPMYDYVRHMGPGYPRACVPICTPSPPLGNYGTAVPFGTTPDTSAAASGSTCSAATASPDYPPKQVRVTEAAVAASAALDTAVRVPGATDSAATGEESQLQLEATAQPVMAEPAADAPAIDATVRPLIAGGGGTNLEEMAGLLRLMPPPPSRRGWARSAAAAGLKPNPPVLTDPSSKWGLTPSSVAAEAAEAEAAAAAAAAAAAPSPLGRRESSSRERRVTQRNFSDRLRDAAERRIATAAAAAITAAAAVAATSLPPALVDAPGEGLRNTPKLASCAAADGAEAAGEAPEAPPAPTSVSPLTPALAPLTPSAYAAGDLGACTAAVVSDGAAAVAVYDVPSHVEDDGANWQVGPACELAVPLAVSFAVPLAVPLPPAVPLPLSAAELAAPSLDAPQPSAAVAAASTADQFRTDSSPPSESTESYLPYPHHAVSVLPDLATSPPSPVVEAGATVPTAADVAAAAPHSLTGRGLIKSVVSAPGTDLSAASSQPGTALGIHIQPPPPPPPPQHQLHDFPQQQQQQTESTEPPKSVAGTATGAGCCITHDAVDPDLSYEQRLRDAIRVIFSGSGGVAQSDTAAGAGAVPAQVESAAPAEASPTDVVRHVANAGLLYMPMEQWAAEALERVPEQGPSGGDDCAERDLLPDQSKNSLAHGEGGKAAAESGELGGGGGEGGGSCLLPAVVPHMERGIVPVTSKGPVDAVACHRRDGPVTRGSLHSQTVTVTIDADCISGVSKVQVDVAPSAPSAPPPWARTGKLPPAAAPTTDAPWVLAAPAVAPPAALLPAASPNVLISDLAALPRLVPSTTSMPATAAAAAAAEESRDGQVAGAGGPIHPNVTDVNDGSVAAGGTAANVSMLDEKARSMRGGEWAFYAGQYNGMAASELRPYDAAASQDHLMQTAAAAATTEGVASQDHLVQAAAAAAATTEGVTSQDHLVQAAAAAAATMEGVTSQDHLVQATAAVAAATMEGVTSHDHLVQATAAVAAATPEGVTSHDHLVQATAAAATPEGVTLTTAAGAEAVSVIKEGPQQQAEAVEAVEATWGTESVKAEGTDAYIVATPRGELLGEEVFNRLTGVPELDRAILTTGGVVPGAWAATGAVKMGGDGSNGAAQGTVSNNAVAVAATVAAARAETATAVAAGPTVRRGPLGNRRRRRHGALLLRLRGEAAKAAVVAAVRAANAAAASTLYGVRVDEMFSAVEDGGATGADAARAEEGHDEYDDNYVLTALVALVAAASGAVSPAAALQPAATEAAAEEEGLTDDLDDLLELARLAAGANGAASPQPDEIAPLPTTATLGTTLSPSAAAAAATATAATAAAEVDTADLHFQAELAAAANGAVPQRSPGPFQGTQELTSCEILESPVRAALKGSVEVAAGAWQLGRSAAGPASRSSKAQQLRVEDFDEDAGGTDGGRHFLPLASAVAMFNQPHVYAAGYTNVELAPGADASPAAAAAAAAERSPGSDGAAVVGVDDSTAPKGGQAVQAASGGKGGASPWLAASDVELPQLPASSLATTVVGLGVAAAAAGAAALHAAEAAAAVNDDDYEEEEQEGGLRDGGEDIGDVMDLQAQAKLAAAANGGDLAMEDEEAPAAAALPLTDSLILITSAAPTGAMPASPTQFLSSIPEAAVPAIEMAAETAVSVEVKTHVSGVPDSAAAVAADEGQEELEALTWLAELMGVPVTGFVAVTEKAAEETIAAEAPTEPLKLNPYPPPSSAKEVTGIGVALSNTMTSPAASVPGILAAAAAAAEVEAAA
ncbi:hypothetical protein VaNZ11_003839, partial [Volvox africanus]